MRVTVEREVFDDIVRVFIGFRCVELVGYDGREIKLPTAKDSPNVHVEEIGR